MCNLWLAVIMIRGPGLTKYAKNDGSGEGVTDNMVNYYEIFNRYD